MSDHRIDLSITGPRHHRRVGLHGTRWRAVPPGCTEACGSETWPCFTYNDDGTERVHAMVDNGGHCNPAGWINNCDGAIEHHGHESHELISGPIVFEWDGNDYLWR
jgi:hypothetical protein